MKDIDLEQCEVVGGGDGWCLGYGGVYEWGLFQKRADFYCIGISYNW